MAKRGLSWRWKKRPHLRTLVPQRVTPELSSYVAEMLEKGVIVPFRGKGFQNRIFSVPKKGTSKRRVILDMSILNRQIPCPSFRMTTTPQVRQNIFPNAFMTTLDLSEAYWHIPIAKSHQKFLTFALGEGAYAFAAMPFGLNIAPRIFTKMCAVVINYLRQKGVMIFGYLDDWLVVAPSGPACLKATKVTLETLAKAGFLVNYQKSSLTPSQTIQWLGWEWRTREQTLCYPAEKVRSLKTAILMFIQRPMFLRRHLERLVGLLNWSSNVDPLGRVRLKFVNAYQRTLGRRFQRDQLLPMNQNLRDLLVYWSTMMIQDWTVPFVTPPTTITITTDASLRGWGYHTSRGQEGSGVWSPLMKGRHINILRVYGSMDSHQEDEFTKAHISPATMQQRYRRELFKKGDLRVH